MPEPIRLPGLRRSKYRAVRTEYAGVSYPSKAEAARAETLDAYKRAGIIRWWNGQPRFRLGCPENLYVADFLVVDRDGEIHIEDVKGMRTRKFARDVKLWQAYGPCDLHVISKGKTEVISPRKPTP